MILSSKFLIMRLFIALRFCIEKVCLYTSHKDLLFTQIQVFSLKNQNFLELQPSRDSWFSLTFCTFFLHSNVYKGVWRNLFCVNRKILRKPWKDVVSTGSKKPGFHVFVHKYRTKQHHFCRHYYVEHRCKIPEKLISIYSYIPYWNCTNVDVIWLFSFY